MKLIAVTTRSFADVFMRYVCIRMQFRSTVLKDSLGDIELDKRYQEFCPTRH